MAEIKDLNTTDASNTGTAANAGFPENMAYSDVNNAARALEGMIARWYADTNSTLDTAGSSNAYTLTPNRTVAAYARGDTYTVEASFTNTGAATINVSSLGAKSIVKPSGSAVASGDIQSGGIYTLVFDGTNFQMAGVDDPTTLSITTLTVSGVTTLNGNTVIGSDASDTVTINADVASNVLPSADNTYDLGASGSEWKDLYIDGIAYVDTLNADSVDIDGGSIDGTTIGAASAAAGSFTTLSASTSITGTLATAAQTNITSVGTLTGFTSTGIDDNASSNAITIDSSQNTTFAGKVSIDAGSPIMVLNRTASTGDQEIQFHDADVHNASVIGKDGGALAFGTNGNTVAMTIDSSQKVGIGVTPDALLHVKHAGGGFDEVARLTSVANSSGDGAFLGFHGNSTSKFYGFIGGYDIGTNEGGIKIGVGNGETAIADSMTALTIDSSGNVGMGLSTGIDGALHVSGNAVVGNSSTTAFSSFTAGGLDVAVGSGTKAFQVWDDSVTGTPRFSVLRDGKTGIGIGTPRRQFHIHDSGSVTTGLQITNANTGSGSDGVGLTMTVSSVGIAEINQRKNSRLDFATNNTFSTSILASGGFCVGKTTDDADTDGVLITKQGGVYASSNSSTYNNYHYRDTSSSSYKFYVGGSGQVNSTSTSIALISDARLKENVRDYQSGLADILKLKPRIFDWKEKEGKGTKNDVGFIAQEFEEVFPDWVGVWMHDELEDAKSVSASEIIYPMVNAIKTLSAEIESLKAEVKALKEV